MCNRFTKMKIKKEKLGDLVWARLKYCPYWPARIVAAPPSIRRRQDNKICVLFFGSKEYGFVDPEKVLNYQENRSKLITKGKGFNFTESVKRIDEYLSDPVKYKSNAVVKQSKVVVKTEQIVEKQLGIKQELNHIERAAQTHQDHADPTNSSTSPNCEEKWAQEKQSLIDKIASLKSENQKISFDMKKSQEDLKMSIAVKKNLETKSKENDANHAKELSRLQLEQFKSSAATEKIKINLEKRVSELIRERDLAQARYKQIQNAQVIEPKEHDSSGVYAVERLLDDKMVQTRQYLVRWEGFDSSHDSWVNESDLHCPSILKKYKSTKKQ